MAGPAMHIWERNTRVAGAWSFALFTQEGSVTGLAAHRGLPSILSRVPGCCGFSGFLSRLQSWFQSSEGTSSAPSRSAGRVCHFHFSVPGGPQLDRQSWCSAENCRATFRVLFSRGKEQCVKQVGQLSGCEPLRLRGQASGAH